MLFVIILVMAEVPASFISEARRAQKDNDSIPSDTILPETLPESSIKIKRDTTTMDSIELAIYKHNKAVDDSLALDSINRSRKNGIDSPVEYSANDSLTYEAASGLAHLYGESKVKYQNMDLQSEQIYMSLDSNLVHATGKMDSTQQLVGTPVFKMGNDEYESDTMAFNFKTKKGLITEVYTQQDDGFLTSRVSKRGANGEMFLEHGRYTTCDDPHPDFYLALSRAKVRPGKDVVFGPAYLVVADVPLPLAVPYGFFPFTKSYSSGLIMPTYGDETEKGFYLRDGGYYFAINDKMDLKLLGEIYTKGSWGISATSNYKKRYRYSGSFFFSYQDARSGEKGLPDYHRQTSYKLTWSHRQDQKANPFHSLTASVNFATSSYESDNLNSLYNPQSLAQTTRTSSVTYNVNFSSIGLNITSTTSVDQNMRDTMLTFKLPDVNFNISRFYPFKRKKAVGSERWYEKISLSYTGHLKNEISAKENKVLHSNLSRDWSNGMDHKIPIQANFTLFDYLTLTPSFNFTDVMMLSKTKKSWDAEKQREVSDTISGFYNMYSWNLSMSANTTLYGFYIPSRKLFGDKVQAIRHVLTPSVSFSYQPDFTTDRYGYYESYQRTNADGSVEMVRYSPYAGRGYSVPGERSGRINFDLSNNVEMKIKSDKDSTGFKKISLIDELRLAMSYDLVADKRPLSDLQTTLRLKLSKSYTLNLSTTFASYVYELDSEGRPQVSDHTTYWQKGKFGRFTGLSQNLSYTLSNEKISNWIKRLRGEEVDDKSKKRKKEEDDDDEWDNGRDSNIDKEMEKAKRGSPRKNSGDKAETDEDGYMAFRIPWNLSIGYNISVRENTDVSKFNYDSMRYPYKITQGLNFSGNIQISDGWDINFSSGYDFEAKQISMTTASLSRDLHCFNMSCSVVLAPYTSYNFSFRCNASTLADALKYDKRSSYSNAVQWY